jgi:hypothetical protein
MKFAVEGSQVKLIPETDHEKEGLDALWKLLIRCDEDSKVLCPVGQYVPHEDEAASFIIQDQ